MAKLATVRWFNEAWSRDEANIEAFFSLMEEGHDGGKPLRFRDACVTAGVPYTLMYSFVENTPELKARHDALLRARAHGMMEENKEIADGAKDEENAAKVQAAKLRCDVNEKLARYWDKQRYGDTEAPRSVPVTIQIANLRGETAVQISSAQPIALPVKDTPLVGAEGDSA